MSKSTTIIFFFFFFIAITSAFINHPTPQSQLKKRKITTPLPPPPKFIPTLNSEQKQYLNAHNEFRRKSGVPPLIWDPNLTLKAHEWAEKRKHDCKYRVHSSNQYGENIYWMEYKEFTPHDVVKNWFDERRFYDLGKNACHCHPEKQGCECGHYLNVIWSTTKRVGCSGAVYCDGQKGVFVVCQYDPAGLIWGVNPFTGLKM